MTNIIVQTCINLVGFILLDQSFFFNRCVDVPITKLCLRDIKFIHF